MSRKEVEARSSADRAWVPRLVALFACGVAAWAVMALPAESKRPGVSFEWGPVETELLNSGEGFGDVRLRSDCPANTVAISGRHFYAIGGLHHFGDEHPYFTRASGVTEGGYFAEVGRAGSTANTDPAMEVVVQALCARPR
jgi:hypothetical protein